MAPGNQARKRTAQDVADDLEIARFIGASSSPDVRGNPLAALGGYIPDLSNDLGGGRVGTVPDAIDYADISDEDLPEEEEPSGNNPLDDYDDNTDDAAGGDKDHQDDEDGHGPEPVVVPNPILPVEGSQDLTQATMLPDSSNTLEAEAEAEPAAEVAPDEQLPEDPNFDDLFGDVPSSPLQAPTLESLLPPIVPVVNRPGDARPTLPATHTQVAGVATASPGALPSLDQLWTQASMPAAPAPEPAFYNPHLLPPSPPPTEEEFQAMWPTYDREDVPKWVRLLPPRKMYWQGKTPLKPPRPLPAVKATLELAPDEEELFATTWGPAKATREEEEMLAKQAGLVLLPRADADVEMEDPPMLPEEGYDGEMIGNVSWNDIQMVCADWDDMVAEADADSEPDEAGPVTPADDPMGTARDWEDEHGVRSSKRRKVNLPAVDSLHAWMIPRLDDPEDATAQIARRVILDLNDPHLLVDVRPPEPSPTKADPSVVAEASSTARPHRTYNVANDEAYSQLKENHQNKVRGTLGNLVIEHSMPARRLQSPYYKVKLARQEARSFHRPLMTFEPNNPVRFSRPGTLKRKRMKGVETAAIFAQTKDLSLADNSYALLLEYAEEYPVMLSNFGMGSRVINYYRRKAVDDTARPKLEMGETAVLMPQDRSPFSMFGHVDPGELVPTLYNGLFRAPIFKHQTAPTDFLVIRNRTGVGGAYWYLRNVDHLYVVGQQFPSVDVPGPNSRRVTTAARDRLRAIAFRKIRRNPSHRIGVPEITQHFPGTVDATTRGKLKEFLQFNKEHKEWELRPGEVIPDEAELREMIRPEDVCLLESTQVGVQHLEDAGYGRAVADIDDDDFKKEDQSTAQQLAPWNTTKNFLHATQGKAMLEVYGEGDPSGKGEAFSFIRTSMKGGFKALGQSVEDRLDARANKELGGHAYNVAQQQKSYEDAIRKIWEAQRRALSSTEMAIDDDEDATASVDDAFDENQTPISEAIPPRPVGARLEDDTVSQFSRFTGLSQRGKVLRITREYRRNGQMERTTEVVENPRVIREYLRRRHALEAETTTLTELKPTGDVRQDRRAEQRIQAELSRLERNKERTRARDKQKGILHEPAGSPTSAGPSAPTAKGTGTQRKCANCGQVGHIKTNKKLCPVLNGTMSNSMVGLGGAGPPTPTM